MLLYTYYFILGILPLFWFILKHKFIFILFILSVLAIFIRNFYDQGAYIFTLRSVLFLLFLLVTLRINQIKKFPLLLFYLMYILSLLPLSKYLVPSIFGIIDTFMIFLSLPLGYAYFKSLNSLKPLVNVAFICYTIFITYIILLNLNVIKMLNTQVDLGYGLFKTGAFSTDEINVISILLIISPFLIKMIDGNIYKTLFITITIISALFLLLNLKRTSIFVPLIALSFYYVAYGKLQGILKLIGLSLMLFAILFGVFGNLFSSQMESRAYIFDLNRYSQDVGETRFDESIVVLEELHSRPFLIQLIGKDIYVTKDIWLERRGSLRILHNDWSSMIVGTGIIGFIFFVILYIKIIYSVTILKPKSKETKELRIISLSLLLSSIVFIVFGGFFQSVHSSCIMMFFIGSSMGIIDREKFENSHIKMIRGKESHPAVYRSRSLIQN